MKVRSVLDAAGLEDVSPFVPAVGVVVAVGLSIAGQFAVGLGIAVGAALAYINSGLLVKRIGMATSTGNTAAGVVVMQLGLFISFTLIGGLTVAMLLISVRMTVAMGVAFFIAQTLEIGLYYRAKHASSVAPVQPVTLNEAEA